MSAEADNTLQDLRRSSKHTPSMKFDSVEH